MAQSLPTPEECQSTFESRTAMALHLWPVLTFAVENSLGGGDAGDKRDWFAGAIVELFPEITAQTTSTASATTTTTTATATATAITVTHDELLLDTETRLIQIMDDEFETVVDDGSAYDVAEQILRLYKECSRGVLTEAEALRKRWEAGKGKKASAMFKEEKSKDQDTDWDDSEEEEDGDDSGSEGSDVEMGDAQSAPAPKEKLAPEVDEDGFTKVTRKR